MLLFRSEDHLDRWLSNRAKGATIPVTKLAELAHAWWDDRLNPSWRPHTREQNQAILDRLGLTGPFWNLGRIGGPRGRRSMQTKRAPLVPPRWFIRGAWAVHRALYSISGGRFGLRRPTAKTYGMLRIHTTGRRTGAKRVAILGYFEDGPNLFTLAMNGWGDPEPAWWLNLQANPDAMIELPDGSRHIRARAATGDERARLWSQIEQRDPNLDGYAARRSRETAVVVFEPR